MTHPPPRFCPCLRCALHLLPPVGTPLSPSGTMASPTATFNVTQLAVDVDLLSDKVAALERDAGRTLFGGGAFETTAFFVALFVAAYQLVGDPTGDQGARDVSELSVYRQWRSGMLALVVYVMFAGAVFVSQLLTSRAGADLWWLMALMLAPWAPVAGVVWRTVRSSGRVRSMMRTRGSRNRLTAVLREYLALGHPGLTPTWAACQEFPDYKPSLLYVPHDLAPPCAGENVRFEVIANLWASCGLPMTLEDIQAGRQISDYPAAIAHVRRVLSCDLLARWWSRHAAIVSPSPPGPLFKRGAVRCRSRSGGPVQLLSPFQYPTDAGGYEQRDMAERKDMPPRRPLLPMEEGVVLDMIDAVLPTGTLSQERVASLAASSCDRCILAYRAVVEVFLESSSCGHVGIRASEWFRELRIDGDSLLDFEIFTLRAAVIPDNGGQRVEGVPATDPAAAGGAPGSGMSSREATDEVFKLLFLVARALVGASVVLEPVRTRIHERYHTYVWWTSYWKALRGCMQSAVADGRLPEGRSKSRVFGDLMNAALRETVDGEVRGLLQCIPVRTPGSCVPIRGVCDRDGCALHGARGALCMSSLRPSPDAPAMARSSAAEAVHGGTVDDRAATLAPAARGSVAEEAPPPAAPGLEVSVAPATG